MGEEVTPHPDKARVLALVDRFFERLAEFEVEVNHDVTLDEFGLVTIVVMQDGEDTIEQPLAAFQSRRPYVQIGVLEVTLGHHKRMYHFPEDEEEE